MPNNPSRIIVDGAVVNNAWQFADATEPAAGIFISLANWLSARDSLNGTGYGVLLEPADEPACLAKDLTRLATIAVHFPAFADGRGYSIARELREMGFAGELRAVGDIMRDQLFYLQRVGFNAFALRADQNPEEAIAGLADFSVVYQGDVTGRRPVYRQGG